MTRYLGIGHFCALDIFLVLQLIFPFLAYKLFCPARDHLSLSDRTSVMSIIIFTVLHVTAFLHRPACHSLTLTTLLVDRYSLSSYFYIQQTTCPQLQTFLFCTLLLLLSYN